MTHFTTTLAAGTNTYCLDFGSASNTAMLDYITSQDDGNMLAILRESTHRYLYGVANSALMNGYSVNSKVESVTPWWQPLSYGIIAVLAILDLVCIALLIRSKNKKDAVAVEKEEK